MQQKEFVLNRMPVVTWNKLGVNGALFSLPAAAGALPGENAELRAPERIQISRDFAPPAFDEDVTAPFTPAGMEALMEESANCRYHIRIPAGYIEKEPILLKLRADDAHPVLIDDIVIEAEAGAQATVVITYSSEAGAAWHLGRTRVRAGRNARIKLMKVQMMDDGAAHADAVGGIAEEGGQIGVLLAELGAARPLSSCNLILAGDGSGADLSAVYMGDGERTLDISYRVEHRGKNTASGILAKGVLMGKSKKTLRDTLDFVSGASGAKGREEENVLMLSAEAVNVSVPLLLCGEDDVAGEHAASSGRPDEKTLFYFMSRGISETEARKLLAEASISSIVEKIPEKEVRESVLAALRAAIGKGEGAA